MLKYKLSDGTWADLISEKITQYKTMPTPSADYVGEPAVQYIGPTNSSYTHNYFYECVANTSVTPTTYSWQPTSVQAGGGSGSGDVLSAAIAPEYSATSTYAVGDICMHDGLRYKCNTAITTAEAWNLSHWTLESVESAKQKNLFVETNKLNENLANDDNHIPTSGLVQKVVNKRVLQCVNVLDVPIPSADNAGQVIQYIGDSVQIGDYDFTHNHFYECKNKVGTFDYTWVETEVQTSSIIQVKIMETPTATIEGKIVQYIGSTTSDYIKGVFYICSLVGDIYKWEIVNNYLPTIGGTLTGAIIESGSNILLAGRDTNDKTLQVRGGNDILTGSSLQLSGNDHGGTGLGGEFRLLTGNMSQLVGNIDKTLIWDNRYCVDSSTLTEQTRDNLFTLVRDTEGKTRRISKVCFTADENPLGSGTNQFEVELHSSGSSSHYYGYIIARNRFGIFISNVDNTAGPWRKFCAVNGGTYSERTRVDVASEFGIDLSINYCLVAFQTTESPEGNAGYYYFCEIIKTGTNVVIRATRTSNSWTYICKVNGTTATDWRPVITGNGGTLYGSLILDSSQSQFIRCNSADAYLQIKGGTAFNTGSSLQLCGMNSEGGGNFQLQARNSSTYRILQGNADGTLKWGSNNILTDAAPTINSATAIDAAVIINNQTKWWKVGKVVYVVLNCKIGADGVARETDIYKNLPNCNTNLQPYFTCYANTAIGACYITSSGTIRTNLAVSSSTSGIWLRGFVTYVEA